jgi:hypothetical protein
MAAPSMTSLESAFVGGASIFRQGVLDWDLRNQGVQIRTNVKSPQALTKLSAVGGPRPYRTQDDFGTGPDFSDRTITAFQSKWDYEFDPENFRNTYLAELPDMPFEQASVQEVSRKYLDSIITSTLWLGVRDAAGTDAADLCNGWGTIIAAEITATNITPITTGAITTANAVTQVEKVANGLPTWVKKRGYRVYVSYDVFEKYLAHYRTLNGFQYQPDQNGSYRLDGRKGILYPTDFMGSSQRIVATVDNNLVFGTDIERVQPYPTPHLNILKIRHMMPVGCEIQDLAALAVNDVA